VRHDRQKKREKKEGLERRRRPGPRGGSPKETVLVSREEKKNCPARLRGEGEIEDRLRGRLSGHTAKQQRFLKRPVAFSPCDLEVTGSFLTKRRGAANGRDWIEDLLSEGE